MRPPSFSFPWELSLPTQSPPTAIGTSSFSRQTRPTFNFLFQFPEGLPQVKFCTSPRIKVGNNIFYAGLYARRNAIPTLTNNDIRDVLMGFRAVGQKSSLVSRREIRSSVVNRTAFMQTYLIFNQIPFSQHFPEMPAITWMTATGSCHSTMMAISLKPWK